VWEHAWEQTLDRLGACTAWAPCAMFRAAPCTQEELFPAQLGRSMQRSVAHFKRHTAASRSSHTHIKHAF
jgi:hypothetical protein